MARWYLALVIFIATGVVMTVPVASGSQLWDLPKVREGHPRLGLVAEGSELAGRAWGQPRTVSYVRDLYQHDATFRSYLQPALDHAEEHLEKGEAIGLLIAAAGWVATGDDRYGSAAIERLVSGEISQTPTGSYYSNVWEYGLAYDWLYHHPKMTEERQRAIEERIVAALLIEFNELDGNYPCVWHGRTQLANNTLIAALSLSLHPRSGELQQRAMVHFADAMRALAMTQGWPEGPSYWIYNRAFPFGLAADCFITATGWDRIGGIDIREAIRQAAYWQLYTLAPDTTFVRLGDCWDGGLARGPGLWQPAQDYYARLAADPGVVAAADYFRALSGAHYHAGRYGWSVVLAYDPRLPMPAEYDPKQPAAYLNARLPRSRVFGRHSLGEVYFIERWGDPNATWISFKAGDLLAHHGHYDQGSFTIHRGSPLAVHSGSYGDYFGRYRLGYFVQTVAVNSLLVHAPGEFSNWCRNGGYFEEITGGQRVVMPTGCRIHSVNDWLRNQHAGWHYEAGDILASESAPDSFDYIAADITAAYNSTRYAEPGNVAKVSSVLRKLAYLRRPNAVVVLDRVVTTDPGYSTRWLLHTPGRPETDHERQVEGEREDGILTTDDRWLRMEFEKGQLFHQVLLPEQVEMLKVGGPHYRGYVHRSGGGENLVMASERGQEPARYGRWRTEVVASAPGQEHIFLNVLWPRSAGEQAPEAARLLPTDPPMPAVSAGEWAVVFAMRGELSDDGPISYQAQPGTTDHLIADLPARSGWRVEAGQTCQLLFASEDGVLSFSAGPGPVRLIPSPPRGGRGHQ